MVSETSNNGTLETNLGETQIEPEVVATATMEKLLQNLQKPSIYPMGQPFSLSTQLSNQKQLFASPLSGV